MSPIIKYSCTNGPYLLVPLILFLASLILKSLISCKWCLGCTV